MNVSPDTPELLSDEERQILGARADILIPASEGMPAATSVETQFTWIDHALQARPDLLEPLRTSLRFGSPDDPASAITGLHRDRPELFDAFSVLVAGAYLMVPEVKRRIGYPGQEDRPISGDDTPLYVDMLEAVVERGPVYRPTPNP